MLGLLFLGILAGLLALAEHLPAMLARSGQAIDRFVNGLARRSISGEQLRQVQKDIARHRRLGRPR
jgi:hypothetical protein